IGGDVFFTSHIDQLAALTVRHPMPAIYQWRQFAAAGGLMSYGSGITQTHRLVGNYAGRILKGEKTAALPVPAGAKGGRCVNLKPAKAFGLEVPQTLLARADEVIE